MRAKTVVHATDRYWNICHFVLFVFRNSCSIKCRLNLTYTNTPTCSLCPDYWRNTIKLCLSALVWVWDRQDLIIWQGSVQKCACSCSVSPFTHSSSVPLYSLLLSSSFMHPLSSLAAPGLLFCSFILFWLLFKHQTIYQLSNCLNLWTSCSCYMIEKFIAAISLPGNVTYYL